MSQIKVTVNSTYKVILNILNFCRIFCEFLNNLFTALFWWINRVFIHLELEFFQCLCINIENSYLHRWKYSNLLINNCKRNILIWTRIFLIKLLMGYYICEDKVKSSWPSLGTSGHWVGTQTGAGPYPMAACPEFHISCSLDQELFTLSTY